MQSTKEVRGWLGVETPPPRTQLDLAEEVYNQQPLTVLEQNAINAKMTLLTCQQPDGLSLYDHLSTMLTEVLERRPADPTTDLERQSSVLKTQRMRTEVNFKQDPENVRKLDVARKEWKLFQTIARTMPNSKPEERHLPPDQELQESLQCLPNLMRQAHYFSLAGAGLPSDFYVRVTLALRELAQAWPLVSLRLWGVVHGLQADYTVAEGELREGEYETDVEDEDDDEEEQAENDDLDKEDEVFEGQFDEDIKPMYKPPRKVPCEPAGVGLNRKVYFVCNQPGTPWLRLPHVTPAQIQAARHIRKFFSGDLDNQLRTFPPFPGTERNYLRAQIARISAATHVSPIGVFKFDEEGEEEEETEGARDTCVVDPDFEGMNMRDLNDPGLTSWVHHANFVLPQGRTTWFNTAKRGEGEEEGEDEEEERNEPDEPEPEVGPPLLTPISEDIGPSEGPAWIVRPSTRLLPEYALSTVHSVIWPGAIAIAGDKGRFFENLYVGWGQKYLHDNFEPALPDPPMDEFPTGPEVIETEDPSPETEAAIKAAMREQEVAAMGEDDDIEDGIIDDDDEAGPDLSD